MSIRKMRINARIREEYDALTSGSVTVAEYNNFITQVEREIMSDRLVGYSYYKNLYETVKPIRGRAEKVKPIGQRRRDWETIEHRVENGQDVYIARLYNTDVVQYYPDGGVKLVPDTWFTPLTAEFMHTHSPFYCYKKYNKLWVRLQGNNEDKHFPIPNEGLMLMPSDSNTNGGYMYLPSEPVIMKQKVVDRDKAKEVRAPVKPFLDWAKMFMKLSDGWIMAETKEQIATPKYEYWSASYDYGLPEIKNMNGWGSDFYAKPMYDFLKDTDEVGYLKALCIISESLQAEEETLHKVVENENKRQIKVMNRRYTFDQIKAKLYRLSEQAGDIYKEVEVEVGDKALTKVV
jgi:hypothetical protein